MKVDELNKRLEDEFPSIYNSILINGKWGIGKTYYIKNEFFQYKNPIYISLFGINNFIDFKHQIYCELNAILGFLKKINRKLEGVNFGIGVFSLSVPYFESDIVKKIEDKNKEITLVIDDLERKSSNIKMEEILGLIESLARIKGVNIIIISYEEKIQEKDKKIYNDFKEKVIQKTYQISKYSENALNNIINTLKLKYIKDDALKIRIKQKIKEFFIIHNVSNLRTIEKAIRYVNFIFHKINNKNLLEKEIEDLVISCLAIVVQDVEKIYEDLLSKDSLRNVIINEEFGNIACNIIENYFNEDIQTSGKHTIINLLFEIYNDKDVKNNIEKINKYYEDKREFSKKDASLDEDNMFYLSEEHQVQIIENFYKENVLKINSKINLNNWFRKLNSMYCYAKIINKHTIFEEDIIKKAMNNYIEQTTNDEELYHLLDENLYLDIIDTKMKEYNQIFNEEKINKYYWKKIEILKEKINKNDVKYENITNVFSIYREKKSTEREQIIREIESNNYFIPNLNEDINENMWRLSHKIWNEMKKLSDDRDTKFENFVRNILEKSSTLGKYRINLLNKQYNIKIDEI